MNDAELRDLWRMSTPGVDVTMDVEALRQGLERRLGRLARIHWLRDYYEMVAAVVAVPVLAWIGITTAEAAVRAGACMSIAVFVVILVVNARSRRLRREGRRRTTELRGRWEAEKREVEHRIRLYRSSWAWFFVPLMVGLDLILAFHPTLASPVGGILICLVSIDILAIVALVVPKILKEHLRPARQDIERLLSQFAE